MTDGETAQMCLVDHALVPGAVRRTVSTPAELRFDDAAFWHPARIVAAVERQIGARRAGPISEMRIAPFERALERARIRIQQQLVRVEAVSALGLIGSIDTVAVEEARSGVGQI